MTDRIPRILPGIVVLASLVAGGCRPPVDHSDRARPSKSSAKSSEVKQPSEPVKSLPPAPVASRAPIHEVVRSALPHPTIPQAEEDAIEQARLRLVDRLSTMNPPIRQKPPLTAIREQYLRPGSRVVRKPNELEQAVIDKAELEPNLIYVEYTIEVSDSQLRQLRMHDRIVDALRVLGSLFVVALAGFLFLRADDWSRGYLTSWLGLLAIVGVVGGLAAVLTLG